MNFQLLRSSTEAQIGDKIHPCYSANEIIPGQEAFVSLWTYTVVRRFANGDVEATNGIVLKRIRSWVLVRPFGWEYLT